MKITCLNNWDMNCYLISSGGSFFLVDTGISFIRRRLVNGLERAGLQPGMLRLILLTHGDIDHVGNAAYLRQRYGGQIAMHALDLPLAQGGDLYTTRTRAPNGLMAQASWLLRLPRRDRFEPDILLEEGDDLSVYGLEARALYLPGHTKGSIGFLTREGDLFNGDLWLLSEARSDYVVDNPVDYASSLIKLRGLELRAFYPGHGVPFPLSVSILA